MRVPLNDLKRISPSLAANLERAASDVIRSGWWLNGPRTDAFCAAFAAYIGVEHCIGVANGTDALEIALRTLLLVDERFRETEAGGPEVVTVANAGGYTTTAARLVGCAPVFAEIEPISQLMAIESAVAALGPRTLALVATHLYGGLVDVGRLRSAMDVAGFSHVPILEDCAQAHGLKGANGTAGSMGSIATFSFYPTKNLGALGDGGAIVTRDASLADIVRSLRQYGWGGKYEIERSGGRNSRLDEIQAAFLHVLLPELDATNAARIAILDSYAAAASGDVRVVRSPLGSVAHLAVVMTSERDRLREHLTARGIVTEIHYPIPDCDQPGWAGLPGRIGPAGVEATRTSARAILTLPCFAQMRDDEIAAVCEGLKSFSS